MCNWDSGHGYFYSRFDPSSTLKRSKKGHRIESHSLFLVPWMALRMFLRSCRAVAIRATQFQPVRSFSVSPTKKLIRAEKRLNEKLGKSNSFSNNLFEVALVGRPNVGKSSLFNRLVGSKSAIVDSMPGTTRDIKEGQGRLGLLKFTVLDTGGLEDSEMESSIESKMMQYTLRTITNVNVILFLIDGKIGFTEDDKHYYLLLKKMLPGKDIYMLVNKVEGWINTFDGEERWNQILSDCYQVPLIADPIPISSSHNEGMDDLYSLLEPYGKVETMIDAGNLENSSTSQIIPNQVLDMIDDDETEFKNQVELIEKSVENQITASSNNSGKTIKLAIVGRPNVGKSTLMNSMLGEDRVLTGPTPGLTRDVTTVSFQHEDYNIDLMDTAGIRRNGVLYSGLHIDGVAVGLTRKAIQKAHVVAVVVDASGGSDGSLEEDSNSSVSSKSKQRYTTFHNYGVGLTRHDMSILQYVFSQGKAVILLLNKVDIVHDIRKLISSIEDQVKAMHGVQKIICLPVSATMKKGIDTILPSVVQIYQQYTARIATNRLNTWLNLLLRNSSIPSIKISVKNFDKKTKKSYYTSKLIPMKLKYITQISTSPPTFVIFTNTNAMNESFERFLCNKIQEEFDLFGIPVVLLKRQSKKSKQTTTAKPKLKLTHENNKLSTE
jgi:GTPase